MTNLREMLDEIKKISSIVENKGLNGECEARFNYFGDEIHISVEANEPWQMNDGYWSTCKSFGGKLEELDSLLRDALVFAYNVPNEEDRAIELMIRKLNEMADSLPKGSCDIAMNAWEGIFIMLKDRACHLANNALPRN